MASTTAAALKFTVQRRLVELVAPAAPTPRELKRLSDIDDQECVRIHISGIQFYQRRKQSVGGAATDPAMVIRDAISRALVHYYPFAGRLRELEGRKLAVECTGEGVLFIEADADVRLEDFGNVILPPFPCLEELIFDVAGSSAILDAPLVLFQVTRLACGGFILAVRHNHTMADALGLMQFLTAVSELARGATAPAVPPVWERKLLEARDVPQPCFAHREYEEVLGAMSLAMPLDDMATRSFFFGLRELVAIRSQLTPDLQKRASKFDIVAGWLWRCRTVALAPASTDEMRLIFIVNSRGRRKPTDGVGIPDGYYGNAFALPVAVSTAGELSANPLSYAVELVKKAKDEVSMEYMQSTADLMVLRGRPLPCTTAGTYTLSDVTKARFDDHDFGWGKPVYGGPADAVGSPSLPWLASFLLPFKDPKGEDGILVPTSLPRPAMGRFVEQMEELLGLSTDVATL